MTLKTTKPGEAHWRDINPDPNSPEVLAYRLRQLREASKPPVAKREDYLVSLANGRRTLDIGIVDHEARLAKDKSTWLHKRIADASSYCLGLDVLAKDIEELQKQGYNVRCVDITAEDLDQKFDVIICGELIEHLGRPGDLFVAARKCLQPAGRFVLSSPNPYMLYQVARQALGKGNDSADHVIFVTPSTVAELASRAGLRLDSYRGTWLEGHRSTKHKLLRMACQPFFHQEIYCPTMIYECILQE